MDADPGSSSTLALFSVVLLLIAANAVLVAAEFALIAVRRARVEQSARQGDRRAARVLPALDRLEELAFAAQVLRSSLSVLLGFLAARLGAGIAASAYGGAAVPLHLGGVPLGTAEVAGAVAGLAAAAVLHATLGQQVPKLLAVHRAERMAPVAVALLGPLAAIVRWPVVRPLRRGVHGVLRLAGVRTADFAPLERTPDEIRDLVAAGAAAEGGDGAARSDEREMLRGVFEFSGTVAREVMTPRTEMVAVPVDVSLDEAVRVATESGHSRIPVYEGTIDSIVGILLVKDLLPVLADAARCEGGAFDVRTLMREPEFVPDTKPVNLLLAELRRDGVHLAVVLDEFGGTYGVVTMEDLLEEIVGEIRDEYDEEEPEEEFAHAPNGDVLIDGAAAIGEVNERFGLALPEEDFDTLGGYIFGALERVPAAGDEVRVDGPDGPVALRVEETEERRVAVVRLSRIAPAREAVAETEAAPEIAVARLAVG